MGPAHVSGSGSSSSGEAASTVAKTVASSPTAPQCAARRLTSPRKIHESSTVTMGWKGLKAVAVRGDERLFTLPPVEERGGHGDAEERARR